jgi:hypothetical protein
MGKLTERVRKHNFSKKKKSNKNNKSKKSNKSRVNGGKKKRKLKSKTVKKNRKINGGSSNLETLPLRYYYPLNDHSSTLSDVSSTGSSTQQFYGGKKNKKTKGGGIIDSIFNGPQINVATGFGTTVGTKMLYDIQTLDTHIPDAMKQPALNLNNPDSPLLV